MKLGELMKNPRGYRVTGIYRISKFEVKTAKNGKAYGDFLISDQNHDMPAKYWDIPADMITVLQQNSVLHIEAALDYFKESPQLTVDTLRIPSQKEIDESLMSLGMMAPRPISDMVNQLQGFIAGVRHGGLRQLLLAVFGANTEFAEQFKRHPGAVRNHHAYIGGLLQHTLEVAEHAADYCARNDKINKDLLITAALLHDVGKVQEIEVDALGLPVGFTKAGKLLRHISLGIQIVDEVCKEVRLEEELRVVLKHCILSHHGLPEWGSPVEPMILEAELLHYLDNLSAKSEQFLREQERTEPGSFHKSFLLRRDVYRSNF